MKEIFLFSVIMVECLVTKKLPLEIYARRFIVKLYDV